MILLMRNSRCSSRRKDNFFFRALNLNTAAPPAFWASQHCCNSSALSAIPCNTVDAHLPKFKFKYTAKKILKFTTIHWKICFRLAVVNLQQNVVSFSTWEKIDGSSFYDILRRFTTASWKEIFQWIIVNLRQFFSQCECSPPQILPSTKTLK